MGASYIKFSSKIDERVFNELKDYASEHNRTVSGVLTEAVNDYLHRVRVRPAVRHAFDELLSDHDELMQRLAR